MLQWLYLLLPFSIAYYTFSIGKRIWTKERNKWGATFVFLLGVVLVGLPIWLKLRS